MLARPGPVQGWGLAVGIAASSGSWLTWAMRGRDAGRGRLVLATVSAYARAASSAAPIACASAAIARRCAGPGCSLEGFGLGNAHDVEGTGGHIGWLGLIAAATSGGAVTDVVGPDDHLRTASHDQIPTSRSESSRPDGLLHKINYR